jgi:hypothetical protein
MPTIVIARFKRAIQYPPCWQETFELSYAVGGYWIARSSRAMTVKDTPCVRYHCTILEQPDSSRQSPQFGLAHAARDDMNCTIGDFS